MPCGGIYPADDNYPAAECFHCGKKTPKPQHFCAEWDAYIHAHCVIPFLSTEEGKIIVVHRHTVEIDFSLS